MDEKNDDSQGPQKSAVSRRQFIAALGATAASATLLNQFAKADNSTRLCVSGLVREHRSCGAPIRVSLGIYPPPINSPGSPQSPESSSRHSRKGHLMDGSDPDGSSYVQPNFLLIMVDQLRAPRWLPIGMNVDALLPNLTYLRNSSYSFNNYFVAATACTPSRATLLTGLYSQQTCIFKTQEYPFCEPSLNPSFENIASVLSQSPLLAAKQLANYQCYWVGKWHLSDPMPNETSAGANGPVRLRLLLDTIGSPVISDLSPIQRFAVRRTELETSRLRAITHSGIRPGRFSPHIRHHPIRQPRPVSSTTMLP